jgi:hypothetical protein
MVFRILLCVMCVTKTFTLKCVQSLHHSTPWAVNSLCAFKFKYFHNARHTVTSGIPFGQLLLSRRKNCTNSVSHFINCKWITQTGVIQFLSGFTAQFSGTELHANVPVLFPSRKTKEAGDLVDDLRTRVRHVRIMAVFSKSCLYA